MATLFNPRELTDGKAEAINETTVLVSPKWLKEALSSSSSSRPVVLDASWHMPAAGRNPQKEWEDRRISTSTRFDVDAVSDPTSGLPHMLPTLEVFVAAMKRLGIHSSRTPVVLYDTVGVFSSPRVWWTLKAFNHKSVAILNGGLPRYVAEGGETETGPASTSDPTSPSPSAGEGWSVNPSIVCDLAAVLKTTTTTGARSKLKPEEEEQDLVVDARSAARFKGEAPEPRAGLDSGHMPRSRNVPFDTILKQPGNAAFLPSEEIKAVFARAGVDVNRKGRILTSCGSGITASVLFTGLLLAGRNIEEGLSLYDGSWTEYADRSRNKEGRIMKGGEGGAGEDEDEHE